MKNVRGLRRRSGAALWAASLLAACAPRTSVLRASVAPRVLAAEQPDADGVASANGVRLAYASFGPADRETILLVAGTGMQLIDWPPALVDELVRRGYRVLVFDHRDVGRSSAPAGAGPPDATAVDAALRAGRPAPLAYRLRDMGRDVVGLLDALGITRVHLVGVSMGGAIAQYVAIDHPERVRSLTTIAADNGDPALPVLARPAAFAALPPPPPPGDTAAYVEYHTRARLALAGPRYPADEQAVRAQVRRGVARAYNPAGLARQQAAALADRYEPGQYRLRRLASITAPTVVLQGAEDPLQPAAAARDIAARVPGAELRVVPGMGHDLPARLAGVVADAVTTAAARAASRGGPGPVTAHEGP